MTYRVAGQAVAVRVSGDPDSANNGLFYLHSDHLGSASAMTKYSDGYTVSADPTRYLPFGGYRDGSGGNAITDRGFTGHKQNDYIKLTYMNARWYDPALGRFISADTIVPGPTNPQSFNRYSYGYNNPVKYFDPSGHIACDSSNLPGEDHFCPPPPSSFPSTPPNFLTDRPFPYGDNGPGGLQAYNGFDALLNNKKYSQNNPRWGSELDAQEAMAIYLNHEYGNLWELYDEVIHETVEVTFNRYEAYCSDGPWSTGCFNRFWSYAHPITQMEISNKAQGNAAHNPRYRDEELFENLMTTANNILNGNVQGSSAPIHYGNAVADMQAFIDEPKNAYWMHVYRYANGEPYQIFVILTIGQYSGTLH